MEMEINPDREGERLDRLLAAACPAFSRSRLQHLIAAGHVRVNGREVRPSYRVSAGDRVAISPPPPEPTSIHPEAIPLDIFFEDDHLLVVNKPAGMVVHPAGRVWSGTLVNALLGHCDRLSGINGVLRSGIVHRLDKETSGLVVVAKDDLTHRRLARQFEERTTMRRYTALVWGRLPERTGRVEAPIGRHRKEKKRMAVREEGGRHAATRFEVAATYDFLSLLLVRLETGRTHQIRVHMAHIGHPVFGDTVYGGGQGRIKGIAPQFRGEARALLKRATRQMLHAAALGFVHPIMGETLRFEAEPPEDMREVLEKIVASGES